MNRNHVRAAERLQPIWRPVDARFPRLSHDLTVDVAVVGAGITGLTLALRLKEAGLKVAVLEMDTVGAGATGHTSGHLTAALDCPYEKLVRRFGLDGATEAARKSMDAIGHIEFLVQKHGISCDFRRVDGWRYVEADKDAKKLEKELDAARSVGLDVELQSGGPLRFMASSLRFHGQGRFDPTAYLSALARLVDGGGSHVFEHTRVARVVDGRPCLVEAAGYAVRADHVVHATHTPAGLVMPMQARVAPYSTYVIGVQVDAPAPPDLYWDTADPYHYIRSVPLPGGGDAVIIGGADHKTGQEPHTPWRFADLEEYARAHFPVVRVLSRWTWEVLESVDGLPYIGRLGLHDRVYGATGFAGTGLTFGTVAALDLAAMILGQEEKSVFRPQRYKPMTSAARFLKENANVGWRMVRDRVSRADARGLEGIKPGEGGIVDVQGKRTAVYRDRDAEVHALSAVCPHAGGIVQWNEAAMTWDCPLHGSRFAATGQLLCGPATRGLAGCDTDVNASGEEPSISDLVEELRGRGYTCDLVPTPEGGVRCSECDVEVPATQATIDVYHRFEGASDPSDMALVAAIRLPTSGSDCLGVLVVAFGPTASSEDKETFAALKLDNATTE